MLINIPVRIFILLLLLCISGYLSCQEDVVIYPSDKIELSFDLDKYREFDLLDYLSIESGVAYLYEKKVNIDVDYLEMFLFSSMGKIIYYIYRENEIWMVLKETYAYKEPYRTKDQTMTSIVFKVVGQSVSYIKQDGENEKADEADNKSVNRIINVANEIISE